MKTEYDSKGAGVKFPLPLVYVIWIVAGALLQEYFPSDMGIPFNHQYWGLGMVIYGIALLIYFHKNFQKAKTNIKPWMLGSFLPAAISLYFIAIKKEEKYLEEKFGDDYLDYKKKVRRWI